jgi:hypothetical protein
MRNNAWSVADAGNATFAAVYIAPGERDTTEKQIIVAAPEQLPPTGTTVPAD